MIYLLQNIDGQEEAQLTPRFLSLIFLTGFEDDSDISIPTDSGFSGKKKMHVKPQKIFETLGTSRAHVQEMSQSRTIEAIMAATMFPTYW